MLGTLIKTDVVEVADRQYAVRFYQTLTSHGSNRYSAEVALGPEDCVIPGRRLVEWSRGKAVESCHRLGP